MPVFSDLQIKNKKNVRTRMQALSIAPPLVGGAAERVGQKGELEQRTVGRTQRTALPRKHNFVLRA